MHQNDYISRILGSHFNPHASLQCAVCSVKSLGLGLGDGEQGEVEEHDHEGGDGSDDV